MASRTPQPAKPVFHFFGDADGVLGEITLSRPVQRSKHEWTVRLEMTGPFREDLDVHGATKKQAVDLALGLCHFHVGGRRLVDRRGASVRVPGKPLPNLQDVDDGVRAEQGLCVCLINEGDGNVRLVLDEVTRDGKSWTTRTFFTHNRYPKKAAVELSLSTKDFSKIGRTLMAGLVSRTFPAKHPHRKTGR